MDGAVETADLQNGAVTTDKLADGSVTNQKLAGSISDSKLSTITTAGKAVTVQQLLLILILQTLLQPRC